MVWIPQYGRNVQLKELEGMWGPLREDILAVLGSTGSILPIGDPKHGQPNATTFKTVGGEQLTFTWSEAPSDFDTKLDLTSPDSFQGIIPIVKFNGTDEEADSPDAAYWTRAAGAFSMGVWYNQSSTTGTQVILSKYDETTSAELREWQFFIAAGKPFLEVWDESANAAIGRKYDNAQNALQWYSLVVTHDGGTSSSGVSIYLDGVKVDDTVSEAGSFTAMEDLATVVALGYRENASGAKASFFNGKMAGAPLGPFNTHKELTADEALRLYEIGRRALSL
jgi:hypothetical protein